MIIIDSWQSVEKKISLTVFDSPGEPVKWFFIVAEEMGHENIVHRLRPHGVRAQSGRIKYLHAPNEKEKINLGCLYRYRRL